MSVWLIARREMPQWQGFIHNKMGQALDQKRLSAIFVGKAALELQVAGFISAAAVSYVPFISWLGLFPTVESVGLQLLFILIPIMGLLV